MPKFRVPQSSAQSTPEHLHAYSMEKGNLERWLADNKRVRAGFDSENTKTLAMLEEAASSTSPADKASFEQSPRTMSIRRTVAENKDKIARLDFEKKALLSRIAELDSLLGSIKPENN